MKLLNVSAVIITLTSFAGAQDRPKAGDLGKAQVKTVVKTEAGSGLAIREGIAKDVTAAAATTDHAFVNKDEVVLIQGQQRFVIPVKSITGVSSTAVNILSISVSPSPLTEVASPPLLVKTKDHYVGIVWTDKSETTGVVLKVGIGEYWTFITALEGAGIKAVNADALSITK